jgi:hypothetical protein
MGEMPATELHVAETEIERVTRWRVERLERAGYDHEVAHELAERPDVDLHRAVGLLENGCSPEMAARILL